MPSMNERPCAESDARRRRRRFHEDAIDATARRVYGVESHAIDATARRVCGLEDHEKTRPHLGERARVELPQVNSIVLSERLQVVGREALGR